VILKGQGALRQPPVADEQLGVLQELAVGRHVELSLELDRATGASLRLGRLEHTDAVPGTDIARLLGVNVVTVKVAAAVRLRSPCREASGRRAFGTPARSHCGAVAFASLHGLR
jgi:hypothetical protein